MAESLLSASVASSDDHRHGTEMIFGGGGMMDRWLPDVLSLWLASVAKVATTAGIGTRTTSTVVVLLVCLASPFLWKPLRKHLNRWRLERHRKKYPYVVQLNDARSSKKMKQRQRLNLNWASTLRTTVQSAAATISEVLRSRLRSFVLTMASTLLFGAVTVASASFKLSSNFLSSVWRRLNQYVRWITTFVQSFFAEKPKPKPQSLLRKPKRQRAAESSLSSKTNNNVQFIEHSSGHIMTQQYYYNPSAEPRHRVEVEVSQTPQRSNQPPDCVPPTQHPTTPTNNTVIDHPDLVAQKLSEPSRIKQRIQTPPPKWRQRQPQPPPPQSTTAPGVELPEPEGKENASIQNTNNMMFKSPPLAAGSPGGQPFANNAAAATAAPVSTFEKKPPTPARAKFAYSPHQPLSAQMRKRRMAGATTGLFSPPSGKKRPATTTGSDEASETTDTIDDQQQTAKRRRITPPFVPLQQRRRGLFIPSSANWASAASMDPSSKRRREEQILEEFSRKRVKDGKDDAKSETPIATSANGSTSYNMFSSTPTIQAVSTSTRAVINLATAPGTSSDPASSTNITPAIGTQGLSFGDKPPTTSDCDKKPAATTGFPMPAATPTTNGDQKPATETVVPPVGQQPSIVFGAATATTASATDVVKPNGFELATPNNGFGAPTHEGAHNAPKDSSQQGSAFGSDNNKTPQPGATQSATTPATNGPNPLDFLANVAASKNTSQSFGAFGSSASSTPQTGTTGSAQSFTSVAGGVKFGTETTTAPLTSAPNASSNPFGSAPATAGTTAAGTPGGGTFQFSATPAGPAGASTSSTTFQFGATSTPATTSGSIQFGASSSGTTLAGTPQFAPAPGISQLGSTPAAAPTTSIPELGSTGFAPAAAGGATVTTPTFGTPQFAATAPLPSISHFGSAAWATPAPGLAHIGSTPAAAPASGHFGAAPITAGTFPFGAPGAAQGTSSSQFGSNFGTLNTAVPNFGSPPNMAVPNFGSPPAPGATGFTMGAADPASVGSASARRRAMKHKKR